MVIIHLVTQNYSFFAHPVHLFLSVLKEFGVGRKVLREPYVTAYYCIMSDGYAAKYRCVGIDDHIVLNDRMARHVDGIAVLIELEALGTERNSLIQLNMVAYYCSLANYYASTVVNAEIFTDLGSGMDVYAGE